MEIGVLILGAKTTKKAINIITPKRFEDIQDVIARMKNKEGLIVNFETITPELTQRMLDFLSGAMFALGGRINKIKNRVYILIPNGIKITTERK